MHTTTVYHTKDEVAVRYQRIRQQSEAICKPLANEDYSVQPTVDVSPPKWHLAHTTWFFEQFVLTTYLPDYHVYDEDFSYLFNSYYNNVGKRVLRPNRGLMTRPSVEEIHAYRQYVDTQILRLLERNNSEEMLNTLEIGLNHEEQHQELLVYDIKYILGHQPTFPTYDSRFNLQEENDLMDFISMEEGIYQVGHKGDGFCYDNELNRHKVYLNEYQIANRLVTNREYLEFIESGGYQDFNLWHADGWDYINTNEIKAPLYWHKVNNQWKYYDFDGLQEINLNLPVMNVSYYEAFAFAEWKGMRLPTEFEWEVAASQFSWGNLWEWTASAYQPYPGFKKAPGAIGEYNGKFMVNQQVLRGASMATPPGHSRPTYRNFFHPHLQWMFSGIRLAK